jgi:putative membrane protein insertion efficiency factor
VDLTIIGNEKVKDFRMSAEAHGNPGFRFTRHVVHCRKRRFPSVKFLTICCALLPVASAFGTPSTMRAPDASPVRQENAAEPEVSLTRIILLGAVTAFQEIISPTDGDRCEFSPTCSSFGRTAVSGNEVFLGVVLTADRLMRCNPLKRPGTYYLHLHDGGFYDPVENNLLSDR